MPEGASWAWLLFKILLLRYLYFFTTTWATYPCRIIFMLLNLYTSLTSSLMTKKRDYIVVWIFVFFFVILNVKIIADLHMGEYPKEYLSKGKIMIAKVRRRKERIVQLLPYIIGNFGAF